MFPHCFVGNAGGTRQRSLGSAPRRGCPYAWGVSADSIPRPLKVAFYVATVEAIALLALAVLELIHLDGDRLAMGITTTIAFLMYAFALLFCGLGILNLYSWARSPIVFLQLIGLGLAWSFRDNVPIALAIVVCTVTVLVGIFAPVSLRSMEAAEK